MQLLQVARENQLSRFGTMSLDGTKIHVNASCHRALSYGYAEAIEAQLRDEVQQLLALAEAADDTDLPDGMNLREELQRREDRLAAWNLERMAALRPQSGKRPGKTLSLAQKAFLLCNERPYGLR